MIRAYMRNIASKVGKLPAFAAKSRTGQTDLKLDGIGTASAYTFSTEASYHSHGLSLA
jgi:hypothetical protein